VSFFASPKRCLAVAALTLLEALRQPFLLLLTASCTVFISLLPALLMHTMGEAQQVVQDSALAVHFVAGLLLAGCTASVALGREIRRGTLAVVLVKPISREAYFLAKFAGTALVLGLFATATGLATLLSAQAARDAYHVDWLTAGSVTAATAVAFGLAAALNYFARWSFVPTAFTLLVILLMVAGALATAREGFAWRVLPASVLVTLATIVLGGIALALVSRLQLMPTLAVCTVIFLAGLMADYLLGRHAAANPLAALVYHLLPNWQHFWTADALMENGTVPWAYVRQVTMYAVFYLLGVLSLGMLAFRDVETKA
jgi:hypothetical protein